MCLRLHLVKKGNVPDPVMENCWQIIILNSLKLIRNNVTDLLLLKAQYHELKKVFNSSQKLLHDLQKLPCGGFLC